ncbi:hypothetical protein M1146_04745, partial [Patescibacteria group bacterium]|nr:hypothetical protein [Patescibacteria group bacterium]
TSIFEIFANAMSRVYVEKKSMQENPITQKKTSDFWNKFIDPQNSTTSIPRPEKVWFPFIFFLFSFYYYLLTFL